MILSIKNMVCPRCIMVVREQLEQMGLNPAEVRLGEVVLLSDLTDNQRRELEKRLTSAGFELLDNRHIKLVEKIKTSIIQLVHQENGRLKVNLSDYITNRIPHSYHSLSTLFSESEHTTIEKYFIAQKIERVKELLIYDELSLNEIAALLNYSSTAHLSTQFKKITGFTPSDFKKQKGNTRTSLDQV